MFAPETRRVTLGDGRETTVHVVRHPLAGVRLQVARLDPPAPVETWCAERGIADAVAGGYAVKPEHDPLGEAWTGGRQIPSRPFRAPWNETRAAVLHDRYGVRIARRGQLPRRPEGDLLQAGPLLVAHGRNAVAGVRDPEGFSSTADEFDEDLTASREPRIGLGITDRQLLLVAADGRGPRDAGMTLAEIAALLVELGAREALNLGAGAAGAIVAGGRRVNSPRDGHGREMRPSSPTPTAIVVRIP